MTQKSYSWAYIQTKLLIWKNTCTPVLIAALSAIAKTWKLPSNDWIKKMWCIYRMEYSSSIKKNETIPFAAIWMDLEFCILSKSERERWIPYDNITYMWSLKHGTNGVWNKTYGEQNYDCQVEEGVGGRMGWEFGISRCKLLYTEWINNKDLMHSTGSYIFQFSIPWQTIMEKNMKKNVYIAEALCCRAEIDTTLPTN